MHWCSFTMQPINVYQILSLVFLIGLSIGKKATELKVESVYKPDDCSTVADDGDEVAVHYTGKLESGVTFDSSVEAKRDPLVFMLGQRKVIPGWEMGIKGMCVGEKRRLVIPPHLAYGKAGYPPAIPEEATLLFDTELMSVSKKPYNLDVMALLKMLSVPALLLYVAYYLYDRYNKEAHQTKELKRSKKRK